MYTSHIIQTIMEYKLIKITSQSHTKLIYDNTQTHANVDHIIHTQYIIYILLATHIQQLFITHVQITYCGSGSAYIRNWL